MTHISAVLYFLNSHGIALPIDAPKLALIMPPTTPIIPVVAAYSASISNSVVPIAAIIACCTVVYGIASGSIGASNTILTGSLW